MENEIQINLAPAEVNLGGILVEPKNCHKNSYLVSKKNPKVSMVEGVIIIFSDAGPLPFPHVWNKLQETHFDVTAEMCWKNNPQDIEIRDLKYFEVKTYPNGFFKEGDPFTFSTETQEEIDSFNEIFKEYAAKKNRETNN